MHNLIIALAGLFMYNVEVSTRLLYSSSPYIYIVLARLLPKPLILKALKSSFYFSFLTIYRNLKFYHLFILSYIFGYYFFGIALHVNWLPFI